MRGHRDLRIACAAAVVCALVGLLLPVDAVRALFVVPLALLLPGYAVATATFARRDLSRPLLALISLSLSLALLALGSLLLNYTPGGIRALPWAILLVVIVVGGCAVAARRREAAGPAPAWRWPRPRALALALSLGGLAAVIAAVALAAATVPAKNAIGFTELWVLPSNGAESEQAQVGIRSQEQHVVPYDLLVRVGSGLLLRRSFRLQPGAMKIFRVSALADPGGRPIPVTATLLRQNRTDKVYRRIRGWLPPPGASR